ncbi:MAG: hypothetical protein JST87_01350 [Bacteroidetes bacterium]|nr:hypothetical protein [Bacteroidota bacterium]
MKRNSSFLFFFLFWLAANTCFAQYRKIDSAMKIGKAGYRFTCFNRNLDKNEITVKPLGFDSEAHELSFYVKGRVKGVQIDDLNNDGYPDLVVYIFSNDSITMGNVLVFASEENKSFSPISIPDVMLDGKLKDGYRGDDKFMLLEGTLMREFPIYKPDDVKDKPTGGKRAVLYQMVPAEAGGFKFKVARSYDTK